MAHRVQQILDAMAAALVANTNLRATVEVNRVRSLGEDQAELPALTVNYGADSPDEGAQDHRDIGSAVEIRLGAYVAGDTETDVLVDLLALRTESHKAIRVQKTLGLAFVWEVVYAGADEPQIAQGERTFGAQTCRWTVRYVMDDDDPE